MPAGRTKDIHGQGTVCKVSFKNTNTASNFTGVWAYGAEQHGFVRLGPALECTTSTGLVPGLGIKFMRSGVKSADYVALVSLDPLPDKNYNFFATNFSNHIPQPTSAADKAICEKFRQGTSCVLQVGLSDMAAYTVDGETVENPVFPYRIDMMSPLTMDSSPKTGIEVINELAEIEANTVLFTISAYTDPWHYASGEPPLILGDFVTEEQCSTSNFGDASLFFQHQRVEEDWVLAPDWMDALDPEVDCANSKISDTPPAKCEDKATFLDQL
mmetsp:Transcript_51357/g.65753  ORF Transcript_51357/g.65753 Transcript_51357/m.65753 type:complete len:271 (-) Transcript_51357:174-986(-)